MSLETLRTSCEEAIEQFRPDGDKTFCNMGLHYIARAMGYSGFVGLLANDIVAKLQKDSDFALLEGFEMGASAQRLALDGKLVIAGAFGEPHGHVAAVFPKDGPLPTSPKWGGVVCPYVANVGKPAYHGIVTANFAFGKAPPRYWAWLG